MSDRLTGHRTARYEVRLQGHLDARWSTWLEGLSLRHDDDGTTVLRGEVTDQAALHGLLRKVRDLGLPLLSLRRLDEQPIDRTAATTPRRSRA